MCSSDLFAYHSTHSCTVSSSEAPRLTKLTCPRKLTDRTGGNYHVPGRSLVAVGLGSEVVHVGLFIGRSEMNVQSRVHTCLDLTSAYVNRCWKIKAEGITPGLQQTRTSQSLLS